MKLIGFSLDGENDFSLFFSDYDDLVTFLAGFDPDGFASVVIDCKEVELK